MKKLTWTFSVTVDPVWVADGFNPDAEQMKEVILQQMLGYAYDHEVKVRLLSSANQNLVAKEQGYKSVKHMNAKLNRKRVA